MNHASVAARSQIAERLDLAPPAHSTSSASSSSYPSSRLSLLYDDTGKETHVSAIGTSSRCCGPSEMYHVTVTDFFSQECAGSWPYLCGAAPRGKLAQTLSSCTIRVELVL